MKRGDLIVLIALATVVGNSSVFAAEGASIDKGRVLFNDPKLGTTGKSCNTCHPDGQNIQKAGIRSDLEQIVNGCITHSIKGKALDPQSIEMQSLILYIKSLGAKQPAAKNKPAVGC
jgi:cytochrome c peroxidase